MILQDSYWKTSWRWL